MKNYKCRTANMYNIAPGIDLVKKRYFKHKVDRLRLYYRLQDKNEYVVAKIFNKEILSIKSSLYKLVEFEDFSSLFNKFTPPKDRVPYKDEWYIKRRYFEFKAFKYKVYGVLNDKNKISSILVAREVNVNGAKILRIVDFIGLDSDFGEISSEIQRLIDENNYEYIDIMCYGLDEEMVKKAGFIILKENDENIIPDYFEPYICKSSRISFTTNYTGNFYVFRADADQDRPNLEYNNQVLSSI